MISPFVGRIYDWYVKNTDQKTFEPTEDPGKLKILLVVIIIMLLYCRRSISDQDIQLLQEVWLQNYCYGSIVP